MSGLIDTRGRSTLVRVYIGRRTRIPRPEPEIGQTWISAISDLNLFSVRCEYGILEYEHQVPFRGWCNSSALPTEAVLVSA